MRFSPDSTVIPKGVATLLWKIEIAAPESIMAEVVTFFERLIIVTGIGKVGKKTS